MDELCKLLYLIQLHSKWTWKNIEDAFNKVDKEFKSGIKPVTPLDDETHKFIKKYKKF